MAICFLYSLVFRFWDFFLLFQQLTFYALSISLDKEQNVPPRSVIKMAILLQLLQFLIGIQRGDCYLAEPAKLAVLLSGASIVFICLCIVQMM